MIEGVLISIVSLILARLPTILVEIVGLCIAAARWKRHPRVSLLTTIGLIVLLLNAIVMGVLTSWLPYLLHQRGWESSRVGLVSGALGLFGFTISAFGMSFLIAAIFTGRPIALTDSQ